MLRIASFLILLSFTPVYAQVNIFNDLEERYMLDLDPESFPALKFEWNFDGRVQGSVNAGLMELLDNKDYEKAFIHFDEAITTMPMCIPAFYYRGICNKIMKKLPEARDDLSKAYALSGDNAETLLELAEVYELQFDYRTAETFYERAIEINPAFARSYFNLGNLSMRQNVPGKAARYFKKALEADPQLIEAHVRMGILSYATDKRPSKTILHFDNALAVDSTNQAARFWRGMMYLNDKDIIRCLYDWDKLVLYNPEDPMFTVLRAFLYLDLKDYEKAFVDLKNVYSKQYADENLFRGAQTSKDKRLDLLFAVSYINRTIYGLDDDAGHLVKTGFCMMVMERHEQAISAFKQSSALQQSALSLFLTGLTYERSEKHDSAFILYNEALKYDNDIFDAHKKRAIYFSELKDWKNSYKHFEEMARLEPGLTVTYRLRSMVRIQFKDFYGCILDLTKSLKIDSTDHEIYIYRAYCKEEVDDLEGANGDYRKALDVNPEMYALYQNVVDSDLLLNDTTHALETIARCEDELGLQQDLRSLRVRLWILQKKFTEARDEIRKSKENEYMLTVNSGSHSLFFYLDAWIDYLQNDHDNALKKLNEAIRRNGENLEAIYLRSKTFIARGEKMKAVRDLKLLADRGYADSETLLEQLR
jgi:tetratricopeptide (TPR) repeat protein